jgi:dihydroorotate dehydrogenase electron transfer subunit
LYEVVVRSTGLLSLKKRGGSIDLIGPLGNGFNTLDEHNIRRTPIMIGGGMGVAPLLALADRISRKESHDGGRRKIYALIGSKTRKALLCADDFKRLGCEVIVATDDGTAGRKGFVTSLLRPLLSTMDSRQWAIYACGPVKMLEATARIASDYKIPCQVSLEERMACGVGACLGCPVSIRTMNDERRTTNEYKMVCKDGPVFDAHDIAW